MTQLLYTLPVFSPELQEVKEGCTYLGEEIQKEGREELLLALAVIEELIERLTCERSADDVALMYNET